MVDYDFKILQPSEFECLSRDLLQARENIYIESFGDGRDNGIDLRFAYSKNKTCIIQCKRYKEWKELKSCLKNEVEKVKRLAPQRYILTTSVDLTVNQKDEIINLFTPYIQETSDILGRKDLNNLLECNAEIEKNYHKLWLASTNVLNTIINKDIVNWSSFELETIEREIRLYVENKSLNEAIDILQKNHYVIISGIPGIGKTTLARMLVYTMLANGFEEFVYITDNMDDAVKMYNKEKRQIFFFDDFLGSNSFIPQSVSFENKLITFIDKIKSSNHTRFILSTREYVLSEAKTYYEKLSMSNIDIAKCTIELENYTKTIRAKILYNHLAEANIPKEYINTFLDKQGYRNIINHQNFNPRVIESIIKDQIWNKINPNDFVGKVTDFFNTPNKVWQFAFENLDIETRYALLVLCTMKSTVRLLDFEEAYRTFCVLTLKELGLKFDDVKWKQMLKVLMDCFIKIQQNNNVKLISMYNPSIADFIVSYLNDNRNTVRLLIIGTCYIEQIINLYTDCQEYAQKKNLVYIDDIVITEIEKSFNRVWREKKTCLLKDSWGHDVEMERFEYTRILLEFKTKFPKYCRHHEGFVEKLYNTDELKWETVKFDNRIKMINQLDWNLLYHKANEFISHMIKNETLDADQWLLVIETINELQIEQEVINNYFYEKLTKDLESEIDNFTYLGECDEQLDKIESLRRSLPYWACDDLAYAISLAEKRIQEDEETTEDDDWYYDSWKEQQEKEDSQIDEMFGALRNYS